jgi:hypothetical protein
MGGLDFACTSVRPQHKAASQQTIKLDSCLGFVCKKQIMSNEFFGVVKDKLNLK